jgi:hypothetical protein
MARNWGSEARACKTGEAEKAWRNLPSLNVGHYDIDGYRASAFFFYLTDFLKLYAQTMNERTTPKRPKIYIRKWPRPCFRYWYDRL